MSSVMARWWGAEAGGVQLAVLKNLQYANAEISSAHFSRTLLQYMWVQDDGVLA